VVGLSKIAAFCRNDQLYETRQAEVRRASLEFWRVPDEARRKPVMESPRDAAARLLQTKSSTVLWAAGETLLQSPADLEAHVSSVYDWRVVVLGVGRGDRTSSTERTFLLSTGRSRVFLYNPDNGNWNKMEDRNRVELPRDTLLYAEVCRYFINNKPYKYSYRYLKLLFSVE
jgi:hypothetical protein